MEQSEQSFKKLEETKVESVSFSKLFTYADKKDYALMMMGTICALGVGVVQPLQIIVFGDVINAFNTNEELVDAINSVVIKFVYLAIGVFVLGFGQVACWTFTSSRQGRRIRYEYVQAIMRQEVGWFDVNEPLSFATKAAETAIIIQDGIGRKAGAGFQFMAMAVGGIVVGIIKGWELALGLMAVAPILAISAYFMMKMVGNLTSDSTDAYGKAGGIAQESLGNIRTILSFNGAEASVAKYKKALEYTEAIGIKKSIAVGSGLGVMFCVMFFTYAAGLYYGAVLVSQDQIGDDLCTGSSCYDGGRVLIVFFSVLMGAMAIGQAGPSIQAIASAKAAAVQMFRVIERESKIDSMSKDGVVLQNIKGKITLDNVTFRYPSRPEVQVCDNYSLTIQSGETIALVGPSGGGKSTIINLLERFYDPDSGKVLIDDIDLRTVNVESLRANIGLVGQEPALLDTSIAKNIGYGKAGATMEEIYEAAKKANAYDFIMTMHDGFDTNVGDHGLQLSGGQKQRIAIARAIIKDPSILLLDEATSALDTESERIVQQSLDDLIAKKNRTTIVIAHRLSTIRKVDKIAVISAGRIVELGSHDELMLLENGHYQALVKAQEMNVTPLDAKVDDINLENNAGKQLSKMESRISSRKSAGIMDEEEDQTEVDVKTSRIWSLSKPEMSYIIFGLIGAALNGSTYPVWGLILNKVTVLFFDLDRSASDLRSEALYWSIGFVGLGIIFLGASLIQAYCFGVVSERLTKRLRLKGFSAMLQQEIGWYDLPENSSGSLSARLATETALIQATTGEFLNRCVVALFTLVVAFVIAFAYSWKMTLILLVVFPVILVGSYFEMQAMDGSGNTKLGNNGDIKASSLMSEAVGNIRTVASFNMERTLNGEYLEYLSQSKREDIRHGLIGGFGSGLSQGLMFAALGFLFYIGGQLVSDDQITFEAMLGVLLALMFSATGVSTAAQNMTDTGKAKKAAANMFSVIDRVSKIPANSSEGLTPSSVSGQVEFHNVNFAYPTRPNSKVYKDYSLTVKAGETTALVGASGGGKSTAIALLERFYDPDAGSIYLDGKDLKTLNLPWLRSQVSLVGQEPVLFGGTIADNIKYGKPDATIEEIHEAARMSNAFDFIMQFPDGFDTDVGDRGVQVSGGQKQRIAIARSIIRNPPVLLLDEATSALDSESERVVQASLDKLLALRRRTTIVIAHRLTTIQNADLIAIVHDGRIVEQGKHDTLMQIEDGHYRNLVAKQQNIE